jgi:hypothetical protein
MGTEPLRRPISLALATMLAVAVGFVVLGCSKEGAGVERVQPPIARATPTRGATEDCSTRSEADFGPAFSDPENLVVGPVALIGAADLTSPSQARRGGQKYPLLVKAGHKVVLEVLPSARGFSALGYGPLPQGEVGLDDGHASVTFVACRRGQPSGSTAEGPVTFWSGFVFVDGPRCVPLDVYVDDESSPRRVTISLGVRC